MSSYIKWILLLALWNVVLIYGNKLGINVILFIIPLLIFIVWFLKRNKKINNKKGLLLIIPIVLLSLTYTFFDNEFFSILNALAIPVLFGMFYVYTVNPVNKFSNLLDQTISLLIVPITYIGNFFRVSTSKISTKIKMSDKTKKVLLSCLVVFPIVVIVVSLLSKADIIFGNLFNNIFEGIFDFINEILFNGFVGRVISFILVFFAIGISMMYLLYEYPKKQEKENVKEKKVKDVFTIKLLVSVLNIIYVIFDFIQIKSLMLHSVSGSINYAEYAREGFFELMVVSIINILIILISKKFETKELEKDFKFINIMNILMVFLTIIIIVSSFMRMNLYESMYGYTTLRLLVYISLMTETILMIPTVMYIFNSNVNVLKYYVFIILCSYVLTNYANIDYLIARRNVDRYYINKKIDIEYLENYGYSNVSILDELYNKTDDFEIKKSLRDYFKVLSEPEDDESIFEFNISKYKGKKIIEEDFK